MTFKDLSEKYDLFLMHISYEVDHFKYIERLMNLAYRPATLILFFLCVPFLYKASGLNTNADVVNKFVYDNEIVLVVLQQVIYWGLIWGLANIIILLAAFLLT
jgi:hypothetical protein